MITVNIANLNNTALDWAVAVCEELPIQEDPLVKAILLQQTGD